MPIDKHKEFINMINKIIINVFQRAETELQKAKYYKEILELPAKKENWNMQETAEEKMIEHIKKTLELMSEVDILMEGLTVFQDGLIYKLLKESGIVRKSVKVD